MELFGKSIRIHQRRKGSHSVKIDEKHIHFKSVNDESYSRLLSKSTAKKTALFILPFNVITSFVL